MASQCKKKKPERSRTRSESSRCSKPKERGRGRSNSKEDISAPETVLQDAAEVAKQPATLAEFFETGLSNENPKMDPEKSDNGKIDGEENVFPNGSHEGINVTDFPTSQCCKKLSLQLQLCGTGATTVNLEKEETDNYVFDGKGGKLQLPESKIALDIPRGALDARKEIVLSSFVCPDKFILSENNFSSLEAIEVLPHEASYKQKLTICKPLKHLWLECCDSKLHLFHSSGSSKSAKTMGVLHASKPSLHFEDMEVLLTDKGLLEISAKSFCQILIACFRKSKSNYLSFYVIQESRKQFDIITALCSNYEESREKIEKEQDRKGYSFQGSWSLSWTPRRSHQSSIEITFSSPNNVDLDDDKPITFLQRQLLLDVKTKEFCPLTYNRHVTVNAPEVLGDIGSEETEPPIIIANCSYKEKARERSIFDRIFSLFDATVSDEDENKVRIKLINSGVPITNQPTVVQSPRSSSLKRKPTTKELNDLSRQINTNWKFVAPWLDLDGDTIRTIELSHTDERSKALEMLTTWVRKECSAATVEKLCIALDKEFSRSAACDVFNIQASSFLN